MSKLLKKSLVLFIALIMVFPLVSCKKDKNPPSAAVEVVLTADKETLKVGESAKLNVEVKNAKDTTCSWSVSEKHGLDVTQNVYIDDGELVYEEAVDIDTLIIVKAVSKEDERRFDSISIILVAPVVKGKVGDLTDAMITELGNPSITVTGVLKDVYVDMNNDYNSFENNYNMSVFMEEGKWSGSWYGDDAEKVITDTYCEGSEVVRNYNGVKGKSLQRMYVNRKNQVTKRDVIDSFSFPAVWQEQHLSNHLKGLNVNRFKYDPKNEIYIYDLDIEHSEQDAWFSTYLVTSLTPMMSGTFASIGLILKNGQISEFIGKTATNYIGMHEDKSYDAKEYTEIRVSFSDIGTTKVADPKVYDAPENANLLKNALAEMHNAKNYTFHDIDTREREPQIDDGEYTPDIESGSGTRPMSLGVATRGKVPGNNQAQKGTLGTFGEVTEEGILLRHTEKYAYADNGMIYHTECDGFKPNNNGTYDAFEFATQAGKGYYKGLNIKTGSMYDELPKFDLSENIFSYEGTTTSGRTKLHRFVLRETAITREVAKQVSYSWSNAEPSITGEFEILVTNDGHLYSSKFNYDVLGNYGGYITTEYSNLGKTKLHENLFDNYVARQAPMTWADTITKYYQANDKDTSHEENTKVVMESVYSPAHNKNIPSPVVFREMFGDDINGPFYESKEGDDGETIRYIKLNASYNNVDEDGYAFQAFKDGVIAKMDSVLVAKEGFVKDEANSDLSGGVTGHASVYQTYVKGGAKDGIIIVVENNFTKNIFISIYKVGDWTLRK